MRYLLLALALGACSLKDERLKNKELVLKCKDKDFHVDWSHPIKVLNKVTLLFNDQCYEQVIDIGTSAREQMQSKDESYLEYVTDIFTPEDYISRYALESYERGYLTFLVGTSYLRLGKSENAAVEFRKINSEQNSTLYNYGQDPVVSMIQAAVWENLGMDGFSARAMWKWVSQYEDLPPKTKEFAISQIKRIDLNQPIKTWKIIAVSKMPKITWQTDFFGKTNSYYNIHTTRKFMEECSSENGVLISTEHWFKKISKRYSSQYHPILNAKSWLRLPVGVSYGALTGAGGMCVMAAGCFIDAGIKGGGDLCRGSIEVGAGILGQVDDAIVYPVTPDLRHWEEVPEAFYIYSSLSENDACFKKLKTNKTVELF